MSSRKKLTEDIFLLVIRALREGADTRMIEEARKLIEFRPSACVDPRQEQWYDDLHVELERCLVGILGDIESKLGTEDDKGRAYRAPGAELGLVLRYLEKNVLLDERQTGRQVGLSEAAQRILRAAGE